MPTATKEPGSKGRTFLAALLTAAGLGGAAALLRGRRRDAPRESSRHVPGPVPGERPEAVQARGAPSRRPVDVPGVGGPELDTAHLGIGPSGAAGLLVPSVEGGVLSVNVEQGAGSFVVSVAAGGMFPGGERVVPITNVLKAGVNARLPGFGSTFGPRGIPAASMIAVADRSARRLAQMMLDLLRPITPVKTGALKGSLALMQITAGSWAVTYGPFYGYFQFYGTRFIIGLRAELEEIAATVLARSNIVVAEELAAESVGL